MFRIGIIGAENSHAMAFSKLFNGIEGGNPFPDCRVVAIMGEEAEPTRKTAETCGIEFLPERPEEMLGKVDAMMVTSRNGALHLRYARPFLEAGIPTFVDKPIANDDREAYEIVKIALKSGVPVMGGSCLKSVPDTLALQARQRELVREGSAMGGSVWAPLSFVNPYGNFYFYSAHLVEMAMAIFGAFPKAVQAVENKANVTALLHYDDYTVSCHYLNGAYHYGATLLHTKGAETREVDLADAYRMEAEQFVNMLRTGASPIDPARLIAPISILNAMEAAYQNGHTQVIEYRLK
ncbi:MAG TPA: Gfo/Idh/MocA family oxidoreductase [Clostridia bacterium]|nr:Gfo/Idh/MocA family oxidoreductase [Clostridia bacterium]